MKKVLSVLLALIMVMSVLTLSACKKGEQKSDAQLFTEAVDSLWNLKMFASSDLSFDALKDINRVKLTLDELSMSSEIEGAEDAMAFPQIVLDFLKLDDKSFSIGADVTLDDESLGAKLEIVDGEKYYLSVPDATELYLTGALEELLNMIPSDEEGGESISIDSFAGMFNTYEDTDPESIAEYITSEEVELEVYGEKLSIKKLTLSMDKDDVAKLAKEEGVVLAEDSVSMDMVLYLDGEDVRRYEYKVVSDGEQKTVVEISADVLGTEESHKESTDIKVNLDGVDVMVIAGETDLTFKDGKLEGSMNIKPEYNFPEDEDSVENAALEVVEINIDVDGTVNKDGFDVKLDSEYSLGGVAVKLPMTLKGKFSDGKMDISLDASLDVMGVEMKLGLSVLLEKTDAEKGTYDAENAVAVEDEEALMQFTSELMAHLFTLEDLMAFTEMFYPTSGDDEYNDFVDVSLLFNIYNDVEDVYFYSDGYGEVVNYYDLVTDEANGTFTITDAQGNALAVITLTGDDTADISGSEYVCETWDYGDGDVDYYFYSNESNVSFDLYPYDDSASVTTEIIYTIDDTTITVNGTPLEYTLDEDAGIMILGGMEYYFVSYMEAE